MCSLSGNMNAGACPTSLKYGWGTDVIFLLVASLVIFIQSCSVIYAIIHFYFIHLNNESMWVWIFIWWKEVFRALPNVTSMMEEDWRLIQSHILEVTQIYLFPYYWYKFCYQCLWNSIVYIYKILPHLNMWGVLFPYCWDIFFYISRLRGMFSISNKVRKRLFNNRWAVPICLPICAMLLYPTTRVYVVITL